jgi:hypothetical protein
MARNNGSSDDFSYEVNGDFDFVLEEGQNSSVRLRKISWNGRPEKVDIRKYAYEEGKEKMLKGISLSDDAVDEMTGVLVENGYGDTKRILRGLSERTEFQESLDTMNEDDDLDDDGSEEYYDPSELLG